MNFKKLLIAAAAVAMSVTAFAITASAEVVKDDNGVITWTFESPTEAVTTGTANTTNWWTYSDTLSDTKYDDKAAAETAAYANDTTLVIYDKCNSYTLNTVGEGKLFVRYANNLRAYYKPNVDGILYIEGTNVNKTQIVCEAGKEYYATCDENKNSITKITFVPTETKYYTFGTADQDYSYNAVEMTAEKAGVEDTKEIELSTTITGGSDVAMSVSNVPADVTVKSITLK